METYRLTKPITALSGDTIEELSFNFDALRPLDYRQIVRCEAKLRGETPSFDINISRKTSSEFRMATAWIAAIKGTKGLCFDDLDSISLKDLLEIEQIGLFFIAGVE